MTRWRKALHEAGHIIASAPLSKWAIPFESWARINRFGWLHGSGAQVHHAHCIPLESKSEFDDGMATAIAAGAAAERLFYGSARERGLLDDKHDFSQYAGKCWEEEEAKAAEIIERNERLVIVCADLLASTGFLSGQFLHKIWERCR